LGYTLDSEGNLIGAGVQETAGNKNRGKEYSAPQTSQSKNAGGIAEFLADNLTGLFNLDTDPEKTKTTKRNVKIAMLTTQPNIMTSGGKPARLSSKPNTRH